MLRPAFADGVAITLPRKRTDGSAGALPTSSAIVGRGSAVIRADHDADRPRDAAGRAPTDEPPVPPIVRPGAANTPPDATPTPATLPAPLDPPQIPAA